MMNGLQTLNYWREYFDHPQGSKLGLFNASMSLGSMLGLFFVPYTGEFLAINLFGVQADDKCLDALLNSSSFTYSSQLPIICLYFEYFGLLIFNPSRSIRQKSWYR
jgi:hypothetical protein